MNGFACLFLIQLLALPAQAATDADAEARDYQQIHELYVKGIYDAAIERIRIFEKNYPGGRELLQVENLNGMSLLLSGKPAQAVPEFRKAIANPSASPTFRQYLLYNLGTAQFESGALDDTEQTLAEIHPEMMDHENQVKVRYLKARFYSKRSLPVEAAREALKGAKLEGKVVPGTFDSLLEQALFEIVNTPGLVELYKENEDSPIADSVLYRLGSEELKQGSKEKGENSMRLLMSRFPQSHHYAQAADILRVEPTGQNTIVDPAAIGVLLPLSGKFARFGQRNLEAIELAFAIYSPDKGTPESKVTLVVEDSGEEPEQTLKGLEALVNQYHVVGVIGPLLTKGIEQVTKRAQELSVPLLSLARTPAAGPDYAFQAGITLQMQAQQIARYAIQKLGMKKFAVLSPKEKAGNETSSYFWDAVEQLGGEIVGAESYNPGDTDFRQQIDKLSGLYYTEARQPELEALAKEREAAGIKRRTRKTEQYYSLRPIVDYQAVFIAEDAKIAAEILPTFAYRDVENVKFLGTSAWDNTVLPAANQTYAESALFVDAYFSDTQAPIGRKFAERFKAAFGQNADPMDAVAYDAAKVMETALAQAGSSTNRSDLKTKLQTIKDVQGVTGNISCENNQFNRDLKVFTYHGTRIVEAP